ncbi:MAG: hypothetical protein KC616_23360 [Myxococcales bacterium]|nr:hypothetical protein [Myxococcales bacterium]
MPIHMHLDEERRRVLFRLEGDFTLDEIFEVIDRAVLDPRFQPGFSVLTDHLAVGEPLTPPQARRMVDHLIGLESRLGGSRWAVVTKRPASFGMMRMVGALASRVPVEVQIFGSLSEAEAWLDGVTDYGASS